MRMGKAPITEDKQTALRQLFQKYLAKEKLIEKLKATFGEDITFSKRTLCVNWLVKAMF